MVEQYHAHVTGIDIEEEGLSKARQQAAARIPDGHLTLLNQDAKQYKCPPASFNLVSCIGATHAFGGYKETLQHLLPLVTSGGLLLVGELYWRQKPLQEYLEAFGVSQETYLTHAENVALGIHQGLIPVDALVATEEEFDAYEWQRIWTLETYVYHHPVDPDGPELLRRIREWRDLYLKWGRTTLGFGVYAFLRS